MKQFLFVILMLAAGMGHAQEKAGTFDIKLNGKTIVKKTSFLSAASIGLF